MGKICSNCRHVLPSTITAGDRCPNCGVLIAYDETTGKKAYWVYFATPGGIGAVIGMVVYAFRRRKARDGGLASFSSAPLGSLWP